jgi:hypothetical protein
MTTEARELPLRVVPADPSPPLLHLDEVRPTVRANGDRIALEWTTALCEREVPDDRPIRGKTLPQLCERSTLTVVDRLSDVDVVRRDASSPKTRRRAL